jgi:excinuclease UvrABC nuclease subunit
MDTKRRGNVKHSSLEAIEGIGPSKARALLSCFKTLSAIKEASVESLGSVKGISRTDAERIAAYFAQKNK